MNYTKKQLDMTVTDAIKLYDGVYNKLLKDVETQSKDVSFNFNQKYHDAINDMQELFTPHMYNPIVLCHIARVTKKIANISVMYWSKSLLEKS